MPHLTINAHDWHYDTDTSAGPRAPALVLAHGASANLHIWDPVVAALRPHFRLFRHDWLGHGRSDKPNDPACYSIPLWADGLRHLFDHWELDRAVLLGHSMGGMISLEFALTWPDRVHALALLGTTPGRLFTTPEAVAQEEALIAYVQSNGMEATWDANLAMHPYADRLAALPGGTARQGEEFCLNTVESYVNTRLAMKEKPHHTPRLGELTMPTAVFIGETDEYFQVATDILVRKLPDATKYVIPDCGHSPQLENPAAAADVLARGLTTLAAPTSA